MKPKSSKAPKSLPEILVAVASTHRSASEPAATRWIDRRVGRALRLTVRWALRTKVGRLVLVGVAAGAAAAWRWLQAK